MGLLKTESLDNVIQNNSYFKEMHTLIDVKFPFSFVGSSANPRYYKEMFCLADIHQMAFVIPQVVLVLLLCFSAVVG